MNPPIGPAAPPACGLADARECRWAGVGTWLLLLAFPWAIYWLNNSWAYSHAYETSGMYAGYFLYWPNYLREFTDPLNYPLARLPWVLPGWLAYHFFTPFAANLALRALVLWGATVATRQTLRRLGAGPAGATAGALLLAANPYFLQAAGWEYVNGAGLLYIAASLFFLSAAAQTPRRAGWLLAAGVAMTASALTYLMVGLFAPVYAWFYLRQRGWPRAVAGLQELGWLLLGGGLLTGLLGLINWIMGGSFWYFFSQLRGTQGQLDSPANAVRTPAEWLAASPWLTVLALGVLAGALLALPTVRRRWHLDRRAEAAGGAALLAFGILATVDFGGVWGALHYYMGIHATYLLAFTTLPLGLAVDRHLAGRSPRVAGGLLGLVAVGLLMVYVNPVALWLRAKPEWPWGVAATLAVVAALLAAMRRPSVVGLVALVAGLGFLHVTTAPAISWRFPAPADARDRQLLIFDTLDQIVPWNTDAQLMLWYHKDRRNPDGQVANYIELAGAFGLRSHRVVDEFPAFQKLPNVAITDFQADVLPQLHPGVRAVLLGDPAPLAQARATLAQKNLGLRVLRQMTITHGQASITATLLVVENTPATPALTPAK